MVKLRHNESCIIIYLSSILARHLFKLNYRQTCMTNLTKRPWFSIFFYLMVRVKPTFHIFKFLDSCCVHARPRYWKTKFLRDLFFLPSATECSSFVNWQWDEHYVTKLKVLEIFAKVNSGHATHTGEWVVVLLILVSLPLTSGLTAKIRCTAEQ